MKLRTDELTHRVVVKIGDEKAALLITPLSATDIKDLLEKHTKNGEIDELSLRRDRFSMILKDWEDVTDADGIPLECTVENKNLVVEYSPEFVLATFKACDNILARINTKEP